MKDFILAQEGLHDALLACVGMCANRLIVVHQHAFLSFLPMLRHAGVDTVGADIECECSFALTTPTVGINSDRLSGIAISDFLKFIL